MESPFVSIDSSEDLKRYVESLTASGDPFEILAAIEEEFGVSIIDLVVQTNSNH